MPAILTHFAFTSSLVDASDPYRQVVCLGGQGPDTFFYNGFTLFKKRKNAKKIQAYGGLLHHSDIAPVYNFMLEYASSKEGQEKDVLFAYIRGMMLHYSLDRNAHPYIFFRSGFSSDVELKKTFSYSHALFEAYLDSEVVKHYNASFHDNEAIACNKRYVRYISLMYSRMNKAITKQDYIDADSFYDSWCDFRFMSALFYSPTGFKRGIYKLFFKKTLLYAMCRPRHVKDNDVLDVLNLKHSIWQNAVDGSIRNESIDDIFALAKKDADKVDTIINLAKEGKDVKDDLKAFVHNIDHDGFGVGEIKIYYKMAWDDLNKKPFKY